MNILQFFIILKTRYIMSTKKYYLFSILFTICSVLVGQNTSSSFQPSVFTWEGATKGNKAVWKADDTLNVYKDIDGVDIQIKLIDPLHLNTTTKNPSEFNDFTKTNTFYGSGNLAFQIKSNLSAQPVCLEFAFSKPVTLTSYNLYDIDMLQSGDNLLSTYQDSIHFSAASKKGSVPLTLSKLSDSTTYNIYGQSVKAKFKAGVNGDISHFKKEGAVHITSAEPLEKFLLCYSNGSEDDGMSNSHAIKIPQFEFAELLGRIEGKVYEYGTQQTLSGAVVRLVDTSGELVINKEGIVMQSMTDESGFYSFSFLPMGQYRVIQINPAGYDSFNDADNVNDNKIDVLLDVTNVISQFNDFIEIKAIPLAVNTSDINVINLGNHQHNLMWNVKPSFNTEYFEVYLSDNGIDFSLVGKIFYAENGGGNYTFSFDDRSGYYKYVKLMQNDLDGTMTELGVLSLNPDLIDHYVKIFPNPVIDHVRISGNFQDNEIVLDYKLINMAGQSLHLGKLDVNDGYTDIDMSAHPSGTYYLLISTSDLWKTYKIIKK